MGVLLSPLLRRSTSAAKWIFSVGTFRILYTIYISWYNIRESNEQCAYKKRQMGCLQTDLPFIVRIGRMPVNEENEVFRVGTANIYLTT